MFVDELDEIPDGSTVIFSAHGVARVVQDEAANRELRVLDATCPLVTKVHVEVSRYGGENKTVILVTHDPRDALGWLNTAVVLTSHGLRGPFDLADFQNDHALIQALDGDL